MWIGAFVLLVTLAVTSGLATAATTLPVADTSFLQASSTPLAALPSTSSTVPAVVQLVLVDSTTVVARDDDGALHTVTLAMLLKPQGAAVWQPLPLAGLAAVSELVAVTSSGALVLGTDGHAYTCRSSLQSPPLNCTRLLAAGAAFRATACIPMTASGALHCFLAGDSGVTEVTGSSLAAHLTVTPVSASAAYLVAVRADTADAAAATITVAHGNATALTVSTRSSSTAPWANPPRVWYVSQYNREEEKYNTSVGALVDGNMTQLSFDDAGTLWIGSDQCLNLLLPDLSFRRLDGVRGGLPYANITAVVSTASSAVAAERSTWLGTWHGLLRYDYAARRFACLCSRRYLNNSLNVTALLVLPGAEQRIVVATTGSDVALIELGRYTLEAKAERLQAMVTPQHNRDGLVAICDLTGGFGNRSSYMPRCGDNDGLYTAEYIASQAFRFAVTQNTSIQPEVWTHVEALARLHSVTGIPGFFARTYFKEHEWVDCNTAGGRWYNSTTLKGYIWKGDTSSDEVTGHMYALPLAHDLLAATDTQRAQIVQIVNQTVAYIVKNGYTLVDPSGHPTTWGRWNPEYVNYNGSSHDDRGRQSLELVGYLLSAFRLTNCTLYLDAVHDLLSAHNQYDLNLINSATMYPYDIVSFDHNLGFLAYHLLLWTLNHMSHWQWQQVPHALRTALASSLLRDYDFVGKQRNAKFSTVYGAWRLNTTRLPVPKWAGAVRDFTGDAVDDWQTLVASSTEALQTWPLDLADWPIDNSQRNDLDRNPYDSSSSMTLLPRDEIPGYFRWSGNPYQLVGGGSTVEFEPTGYLSAYWQMRYYGIVAAPSTTSITHPSDGRS